jgi:tetratricopeptide (TPR) repeat protein
MTSISWRVLLLALLAFWCRPGRAQVRVWQGTLSLPVYEEELPDPNPPFDQLATSRFNYPYTLRTHLTGHGIDKSLRAVFLENDYLKCSILPDLGGHLYTCTDKINGRPMFYANPSIKKANVGYRGAWAAFGMEFNFPVSHNWVSLSPVDFALAQHRDGSGSVTVGNIDRVYGMQWSVEMLLRPKSAVLEQRVRLSNPSDVRRRFYWWNNAAIQVWDDSQIEYPMRFAASHGFKQVQPWPVDSDGRDLSIIRNQTEGPVSLFVDGSREPFMGVWNSHTNSGTVHFANYEEVPGKKIWSWGADADGLDWRQTLSDNNSAYVEVQSGLFRNQETYAFLEPGESIQFSEYWMPVRGIGGITRANLTGVLAMSRRGGSLAIGFDANRPIPAVSVSVVANGNHEVWSTHANLAPERTWSRIVHLPDQQGKYTVEIRDRGGSLLMRQTEDEYDWTPASEIHMGAQAAYQIPPEERRREDDWIQLGETQELNGNLLLALETYTQWLQRFPESYGGLKAAGRLSAALLRFDDAVKFLEPVHSRNTTDAEASYYLGIAYDGIGRGRKSREALENAYRSPVWRAAAALRLGELSGREQDLTQAEHYFREALRVAPQELRAGEELVAIERALGKEPQARMLAQAWLRRFPLSYFLRNELGMVEVEELANDPNRVLNIAREYLRLGIDRSALDVLSRPYPSPVPDESEPGALPARAHPMLAYFRAYCRERLGQSGAADRSLASILPTAYVFPNSADDFDVLRAAVKANPEDGNAHYLLGTFYFSRGLTDLALAEWKHAQELNARIPVLDASIGMALLYAKNDAEEALDEFREGIRNDSKNPAVYVGADQALSILQKSSRERVEVLELYPDPARMPSELVFELALNLSEGGDFDRAAALFRHRFVPREEGGTNVRQVWVEVQLQRALKLAEKGDCGAALSASQQLGSPVSDFPFTSDGLEPFVNSARTTYLLGKLETQCGKTDESGKRFQTAATKTAAGEIFWAWLSAKELPDFDQQQWTPRLGWALEQASEMAETSSFAGWWVYNSAMLNRALGHGQQAEAELRKTLLLPDRLLSYHLARAALAKQ